MIFTEHLCDYPIAIGYRSNGLALVPYFVDDDADSETMGEEILKCPRCREIMIPGDFPILREKGI